MAVVEVGERRIVSMAEAYLLNKSINRKAAAALIRRIDSTSYEGDLAYLVKKRCEDCAKYEGRTSGFIQSDLVAMLTAPFTGPKVKVEIMSLFLFSVLFHSIKPKILI